ncbi:MAG: malectin domain-containing carbohydrate-binding protein, partial [Asticcacaulis sp.]
IRQNYNHPSIIMWSVGNETDLTPTQQKTTSKQGALIKALSDIGHAEDPSRVTTLADCCERLDGKGPNDAPGAQVAPRDQVVGLTDVAGYNRYYGWYVGKPADFGPFLDQAHAVHAALPIGVSEYGAGGALSQHTDNPLGGPIAPKGRPHPEEYESWYHEESWPQIARRPYIWGVFIWNMFDFSSDSRAEGEATDINDKGLVSGDRAVRKDVFYYYRANWNAEPTLHINGRRYIDRAYAVTDVSAYSNAHEARLSVNGAEVGTAQCGGGICVWPKVHLQPGGNSVNVAATINGAVVSDSVLWQFNGDPKVVNIHAGSLEGFITADGERFGSDNFFTGGQGHNTQGAIAAGDPALYSSYREGMSGYDIPVPDGDYYVRFSFIEPSASKPGERVFDISINGTVVRPALDVFTAAGGKLAGVDTVVKAQAKGGALHIGFTPRAGQPVISGIEVAPAN